MQQASTSLTEDVLLVEEENGDNTYKRIVPISLRNSTYWFKRIAELHHVESDTKEQEKTQVDVVYEHQRYHFLLGWGSKGHLLPMDPKKYTDANWKKSFPTFPTVRLPVNDAATEGSWKWITSWHIDRKSDSCDDDGWTYGKSFSSLKRGNGQNTWKSKYLVRRRRWIRLRSFSSDKTQQNIVAVDESHLDCVRGYLYKLGHRRKNWKRRYFQLQSSRLLYYTDDSRTRLKGEVLMFHQSIRVQYVDIRVSGRENTFSIDVGDDYTLLLQAETPQDREDWIYAIEDVLLCRDSYRDDKEAKQRRDDVLRRRAVSADVLRLETFKPATTTMAACQLQHRESCELSMLQDAIDRNRISRFIRKFQTHYYSTGLFSSHSVRQRAKEFFNLYRDFIQRMLNKALSERSSESIVDDESLMVAADTRLIQERDIILHELERLTFVPLQEIMYHLLADDTDPLFNKSFELKKQWMSQQTQEFFDISQKHLSPSFWEASIALMNSLDTYSLPSEKTAILVQVAHSIVVTFESEQGGDRRALAADDFLPIFVFVLCNCSLKSIVALKSMLSETMIHSIGVGEKGYYVTMLEAAVEYVATFTDPDLPPEISAVSPVITPSMAN